MENYMKLEIAAKSINESFARSAVAAFALSLSPSLSELSDIKTAVSEAVTNAIVHAYHGANGQDKIEIECQTFQTSTEGVLHIKITDFGCGISDVEEALKPFFTTLASDERSGMGFTIMQTFSDGFSVTSEQGKGTCVTLTKRIGGGVARQEESYPSETVERERVNA
ncbi:MAG: anti-sigma F factor [Clostridiales bacterium]|nr:anti-sigma F factor [Clostridiales bacterium]MBQ3020569.1 anti-sigma F factor [Clostridia bacterium]